MKPSLVKVTALLDRTVWRRMRVKLLGEGQTFAAWLREQVRRYLENAK